MNKKKKVVFEDTVHNFANLRIRLKYDKITQKEFFSFLVSRYVSSDPRMVELVDELKQELLRIGKKSRMKALSDHEAGRTLLKNCGLTKADKNEIYDLIEKEYKEEL